MTEEARGARYSDLFEEGHRHPSDCAYCPICATIGVVRNTKPEVMEHLAAAARELIAAAGILLEEAGEAIGSDAGPRAAPESDASSKVRRIDIG